MLRGSNLIQHVRKSWHQCWALDIVQLIMQSFLRNGHPLGINNLSINIRIEHRKKKSV